MRRRGPDAAGFAQAPGFAAAHRRLSILDPDGSPQPWVDAATGDILVFNGEIYNYAELRRTLQMQGEQFRSAGDTEVLLRALQHWGLGSLPRLNGMFALAWYRARDRRLWLVRDHAGIKPLFFMLRAGRCWFASSMAAMLTFPEAPRGLDLVTFSHYLSTIRTTLGQRTLVGGVSTLEAGHLLEISPAQTVCDPIRWWSLPAIPAAAKRERPMHDVADEVFHRVRTAVRRQLVSDVPLGGFLSGGLDSTIIASQASELGDGEYRCYAVGYLREDAVGNPGHEFPYVDMASQHLGVPCEKIVLDEHEYLDDWQFLIDEKGQPLSTPNEVGIYRLASALRTRCTVALSGEGADEIFAGYTVPYASAWDFARAPLANAWPDDRRTAFQESLRQLYGVTRFTSLTDHYFRLNSWVPLSLKYRILTAQTIVGAQHDEPMFLHYRGALDELRHLTPMDRYLHLLARSNLEGLLSRLDSSTMAASVESRVPFTDPEVMASAFVLRDHCKLDFVDDHARVLGQTLNAWELDQRGYLVSKRALREAFRHAVPQSILQRSKVSFAMPFQDCLAGPWLAFARETLQRSVILHDLCEPASLAFLLDNIDQKRFSIALWPLLNLALWAEAFGISLPGTRGLPLTDAASLCPATDLGRDPAAAAG